MVMVTPDYYSDFKCIADRCRHSCCVGWEIDIDDITLENYNNLKCDFASKLKSNIEFAETPHFKLGVGERCPFLNSQGLCDIIINLGEDMLCQICVDHPRFRNYYDNYVEVGLGLCCEAAAEIVLSKKEKTSIKLTDEIRQIPIINFREKLFSILQDRSCCIDKRIDKMLNIVEGELTETADWYSVFNGLEKLDKKWDEYLLRIKDGISTSASDDALDVAYEQFVVYLIFRHFTDCQYDGMLKERVLFAALMYKVVRKMNVTNTFTELLNIVRVFSCEIEYSDENIQKLLDILSK